MKKNILAILALSAVMAMSTAAMADEIETTETDNAVVVEEVSKTVETTVDEEEVDEVDEEETDEILLISSKDENEEDVDAETTGIGVVREASYVSNQATVVTVGDGVISTTTDVENKDDQNNTVNFVVAEDTLVYDSEGNKKEVADIKENDVITVYTAANEPAVLMLPVEYKANVVIINGENGNVNVDTYSNDVEGLTNGAVTLNINVDENTIVVDADDNEYTGELSNANLIVFYNESTKSIPAQTTPSKVVVISVNEEDEAIAEEEVEKIEDAVVDYSVVENVVVDDMVIDNLVVENDVVMVPLRQVAEAAGFVVGWNGETRTVTLNDGMYSFNIDENSYVKAKMTPMTLSVAPIIIDDFTYVPVEFFVEVTESATVEGTSLVVNAE